MAYTTINKSSDYFNTKLYTGNSSARTISSVGHQPDFTWIKHRDGETAHMLFDSVRGALKRLQTNTGNSEATASNTLSSWNSDGFAIGTENDVNGNNRLFTSWNWKAGTTSGITQGGGTITPTAYSISQTAGFSCIKYTGNTTDNASVPHGLGKAPSMIIGKDLSDTSGWGIWHKDLTNAGYKLQFGSAGQSDDTALFGGSSRTAPSNDLFYLGSGGGLNGANANVVYCFTDVQGYSKIGSFVGSSSQQFIYTGFKPKWFMWKNITQGRGTYDHWNMVDTSRQTPNGATDGYLRANQNSAESSFSGNGLFFLSNGIQFNNTGAYLNNSGDTYIFQCYAEAPLVGTNNVPCTAR